MSDAKFLLRQTHYSRPPGWRRAAWRFGIMLPLHRHGGRREIAQQRASEMMTVAARDIDATNWVVYVAPFVQMGAG